MKNYELMIVRSELEDWGASFRCQEDIYQGPYLPFQTLVQMHQWSQCTRLVERRLRRMLRLFQADPTQSNLELCARGVEFVTFMRSIHVEELKRDAMEWLERTNKISGRATQRLEPCGGRKPSQTA